MNAKNGRVAPVNHVDYQNLTGRSSRLNITIIILDKSIILKILFFGGDIITLRYFGCLLTISVCVLDGM